MSAGDYPNSVTLSVDLEVSRRQIFTDMAALREMGAPVEYDARRWSWYYSNPTYILPAMRLSEGELLAFFLSVEIARSSGNAGFREPLQKAVTKIAGNLGEFVSVDLNALGAATSYSFSPAARVDAETYLQLHRAGASRQKVRMRYYTARSGKWNIRVVHPYHLHFARGDWLLFAYDEDKEKEKILSFNIARISQLDTRDEHFQVDPTFDAKEYVRTMFFAERGQQSFQVAVRFDEYQLNYLLVCQRKLWLYSHGIEMERENENVQLGKSIGEASYNREKKEINLDNQIVLDWAETKAGDDGVLTIDEVKKSKAISRAHRLQMLFYLHFLKEKGVAARGVIDYPELKARETIELDEKAEAELLEELEKVAALSSTSKLLRRASTNSPSAPSALTTISAMLNSFAFALIDLQIKKTLMKSPYYIFSSGRLQRHQDTLYLRKFQDPG